MRGLKYLRLKMTTHECLLLKNNAIGFAMMLKVETWTIRKKLTFTPAPLLLQKRDAGFSLNPSTKESKFITES
jgi:hypothetical protein